jgi:16S rRNA (adenine1518-N6/adenine1519-N6)-dimethyltransferase
MTVPKTVFVPQPNFRRCAKLALISWKKNGSLSTSTAGPSRSKRRMTAESTLGNNLPGGKEKKAQIEEVLQETNIDGKRRGESLSIEAGRKTVHYRRQPPGRHEAKDG